MKSINNTNLKKIKTQHYIFLALLSLVIIIVSLCLLFSVSYAMEYNTDIYEQALTDLNVALGNDENIKDGILSSMIDEQEVTKIGNIVSSSESISFLGICNDDNRYIYCSDKSLTGTIASTDGFNLIKNGVDFTEQSTDTKISEHRVYSPILSGDKVIGYIVSAVTYSKIDSSVKGIYRNYFFMFAIAVVFGVLASIIINKGIKNRLQGETVESTNELMYNRDQVFDMLNEGLIAVNTQGKIILFNKSAMELLSLSEKPEAHSELPVNYFSSDIIETIASGTEIHNKLVHVQGKDLMYNIVPIKDMADITSVMVVITDITSVKAIETQLNDANYVIETLRAYSHNFMNKLHIILGYLEVGQIDEAKHYIEVTHNSSASTKLEISKAIHIPFISAILLGKSIHANEFGINLSISPDSYCSELTDGIMPEHYMTIIGNLVDNAIDAFSKASTTDVKKITVDLKAEKSFTIITVDDNGCGMSEELIKHIFEKGFSVKGEGRGTGLYELNKLIKSLNGTMDVDSEVDVGTSFSVQFSKQEE